MSTARQTRWPPLNVITPFHLDSCGSGLNAFGGTAPASTVSAAPGANYIVYIPFVLCEPALAVKMSYAVGATSNGNCDIGIYDELKNRLVNSGSTAQGTANTLQELDITDTFLQPGRYFMALTLSSATGTWFRGSSADETTLSNVAVYDETPGSFGLPATAAWVFSTSVSPQIPLMGVHFDTLI